MKPEFLAYKSPPLDLLAHAFGILTLILATCPYPAKASEKELPPIIFAQARAVPGESLPEPSVTEQAYVKVSAEQRETRTRMLILGAASVVGLYGARFWWRDGLNSDFRTVNEGWFGQNTYAGGADKLGHGFTAYVGTRLLTRGFEWAGNDPGTSLRLGTLTALGTMMTVEIIDGFSERFRFSKEDSVMNVLGAGLGYLMEKNPALDRLLDFRIHYWPSADARRLGKYDPIEDHSGQTYLVAIKATGIPSLRTHEWLRYFELAAGYGSRGYKPNDGTITDRSRHVYFGISLNLSQVLADTVFKGAVQKSRTREVTDTTLEYIQVPGTALMLDHRL
jgi:hypothetical protein